MTDTESSWVMQVWSAIPDVAKYITAVGAIFAAIVAAVVKGERILLWLLQAIYRNKGGLRLVKARRKGYWQIRNSRVILFSDWYATSILPSLIIRILTVHVERHDVDGMLIDRSGGGEADAPAGSVSVRPGATVEFEARVELSHELIREGEDFSCELVFTDSFNNRHYAKTIFAPSK